MHLTFVKKLGFITNIRIQKIDSIIFKIYKMIISAFLGIN